jgi:glycerophosphoryl diester phosphodiesterase
MRVPLPPAFLKAPIAHRGYHDAARGRPENSLPAFQAAVDAGYGIELDVQITADGQAMVFHDDTLDHLTTRTGPVAALTAAQLGQIALRDSLEKIPSLAQVLALVAGRVPVLVEMKDRGDTRAPTDGQLSSAVAVLLTGYAGPAAVMSFNPHLMDEMARFIPRIARGLVTEDYDPADNVPIPADVCARLRGIPDYDRTGSSFISHKASDLGRARVADLKRQGAAILCWTIRSRAAEKKARKVADNITFEGYAASIPA